MMRKEHMATQYDNRKSVRTRFFRGDGRSYFYTKSSAYLDMEEELN